MEEQFKAEYFSKFLKLIQTELKKYYDFKDKENYCILILEGIGYDSLDKEGKIFKRFIVNFVFDTPFTKLLINGFLEGALGTNRFAKLVFRKLLGREGVTDALIGGIGGLSSEIGLPGIKERIETFVDTTIKIGIAEEESKSKSKPNSGGGGSRKKSKRNKRNIKYPRTKRAKKSKKKKTLEYINNKNYRKITKKK